MKALLEVLSDLSDPDCRSQLVAEYLKSGSCTDKSEGKKNRLKFGYFSEWDLIHILLGYKTKTGGQFGVNQLVVIHVVERRKRFGLITQSDIPASGEIRVPSGTMRFFHELGLDRNIVFGIPYTVDALSHAVPAINVRSAKGDIECGSGIILKSSVQEAESILVTNKHVIEDKEIVDVRLLDKALDLKSSPILHPSADLAAFSVTVGPEVPVVPLDEGPPILTPIIELGYPRIPIASGQFLMAHRGEINGKIETLFGHSFLAISCVVSPGNSGGPIITEAGFCAGIVTQSGIAEYGTDDDATGIHRTAYHMAIPPELVSQFIKTMRTGGS